MKHILVIALVLASAGAAVAADVTVSQKGRAFNTHEITINVGDTVNFTNDDEFLHQIYVDSPTFKFDSAESEPGNTIPLKFTVPGDYAVHCHIHPKMGLIVHVN